MNALAQLAEELNTNERTLRRALNAGSLRASRTSPRTVQLSLAERRYIRRAWPLISALRGALRTEHNVRFALLFGSAARGTDTARSDVDLLVALRDGGLDRVVDLERKLARVAARRVEIVRLEDAQLRPSLLAQAIGEGRVLVDRDDAWATLDDRLPSLIVQAGRERAVETETALAGIDRLLDATRRD